MKRTIFRDRETGRFASHATWNRSKAHGGTRYVRQRIETKEEFEPEEWEGSADYEEPE